MLLLAAFQAAAILTLGAGNDALRDGDTGSLDETFDLTQGGKCAGLASHGGQVLALGVQSDGKVVLGGDFIG